jgi:hypothetical protein
MHACYPHPIRRPKGLSCQVGRRWISENFKNVSLSFYQTFSRMRIISCTHQKIVKTFFWYLDWCELYRFGMIARRGAVCCSSARFILFFVVFNSRKGLVKNWGNHFWTFMIGGFTTDRKIRLLSFDCDSLFIGRGRRFCFVVLCPCKVRIGIYIFQLLPV